MHIIRMISIFVGIIIFMMFSTGSVCNDGPDPNGPDTTSIISDGSNLYWGIVSDSGTLLDKEYFFINHTDDWKISYWVGYFLSDSNLQGDTERTDDFRPDPDLLPGSRAELEDYRGSGYDRGHNAPAAAFKRSEAAMSATFLLSNMSPQTSSLNRGRWKVLEAEVRDSVVSIGNAWIFTGNIFMNPDSQLVDPAEFIGPGSVAVPTHCFKAILTMSDDSSFSAFAFLMPNQSGSLPGTTADYMMSVDRLEEITGYDFFPKLRDSIEDEVEGLP